MNWTALLAAIATVESGGDPLAVGDGGDAWGVMQIHQAVLDDVHDHYGLRYKRRDCMNPIRAKTICSLYLTKWCGREATSEVYARTWKGGPKGAEKEATLAYWEKVRPIYEELAGGAT